MEAKCFPKRRWTFSGLHGVASGKYNPLLLGHLMTLLELRSLFNIDWHGKSLVVGIPVERFGRRWSRTIYNTRLNRVIEEYRRNP
jgi:hypothetical protein